MFRLDGKHWPFLILIGFAGTWIIRKKARLPRVPMMMRILIWNWALLFLFAVAALYWQSGGYSAVHMYNYWLLVLGVAFFMSGATLQSRIGWIGFGFIGVGLLKAESIRSVWVHLFTPGHAMETPVFIVKTLLGGMLLGLSWWMINRSKAGAVFE